MQQETNTQSKQVDRQALYFAQKIHNEGVKDQLSDQKINNKRAACSDTTC